MQYPKLQELNTSRQMIDVFRGYNHNLRIGEGEFYDMKNLTSAGYPVLSPRSKRGIYATPTNPTGLIAKDSLCYVDGANFYINNFAVENTEGKRFTLHTECNACSIQTTCPKYKAGSTKCEKTMISMGAYVIIMPDKKWVNTVATTTESGAITFDFGEIEETNETVGTTTFSLCKLDGSEFKNIKVTTDENGNEVEEKVNPPAQEDAPKNPNNLDYWIDTSGATDVIKQYSETNKTWTSVATTYIKISSLGIGENFEEGDGVMISGVTATDKLKEHLDGKTTIIWNKSDNYIIVTGILDELATQSDAITVKRQMPNMDFIVESGNRLWGCRYGIATNGEVVNEIYASKLGDFKNWNSFAGISTDSYVASVGTDGQFTGAVTHLGYPIFFKENCMHKVYGNYPANYQIQTTSCRGVQKGCSKSLAIVNETLFYKSRSAVCSYDGSLPVEISSALGDVSYSDAVAGSIGNKYYISMKDDQNKYSLFVYDVSKGMWHREDDTKCTGDMQVSEFCNCRGDLYFIDYADKQIKTVNGTGDMKEDRFKWMATTGVMGTDSPDKKYISRIVVRLLLEVGSMVRFSAEYDSSGEWEHLFTMSGTKLSSFSIPIKPKRCDHLRLRIDGEGEAKIFSITKTIEQGSDV